MLRRSLIAAGIAFLSAQATHAETTAATSGSSMRIVSIGGAVTEILYALGKEKSIVGIDTTSLYPPSAAKEKPSIGYMRQLSAEGVLGLNPGLILAIEGSGPKDVLSVLEAAKVPMVIVPDPFSGEGIIEKTRVIAHATSAEKRGKCIIDQVRGDLAALEKFEAGIKKPKRVLFVLSFVNGRAMASGTKTAADGMIRLAGAVNAIAEYEGYRPISDEAVIAAKPDVIMSIERSGQGSLSAETVFAHPAFLATPAASNRAFLSMEGLYLLGFGPRSARAARDVAATLYPDLKAEALPSERQAAHPPCTE
jgi:iron complex transport system substrate-binding protein